MPKFVVFFFLLSSNLVYGQITVQLNTLPNAGDILLYQNILPDTTASKVDNQVFQVGANISWDFSNLSQGFPIEENYEPPVAGSVSDSFPDADIVLDFIGLKGFAKRNTTDLSILGIAGDSIVGFALPLVARLSSPFVIRRAPFAIDDQFSTSSSFSIALDASVFDTIPAFQDLLGNIPGTTVDSLRVTLQVDRSEDVDAWGMITIPSGSEQVLKVTQTDVITTGIEIYATTFVGSAWVDLSPFLPDDVRELLSVTSTNHQFFGETNKEIIAEFTMAPDSTMISVRYARDITSSLFRKGFKNQITANIFPNPVANWVEIQLPNDLNISGLSVYIYNIRGEHLMTRKVSDTLSSFNFQNFSTGTYILNVQRGSELLFSESFVKAR